MGYGDRQTVGRFLGESGLMLPISAEVALAAAGLWPVPWYGAARLVRSALYYDRTRRGWEREVWLLVCGELLRREGRDDGPDACCALARAFGAMGPVVVRAPTAPVRARATAR